MTRWILALALLVTPVLITPALAEEPAAAQAQPAAPGPAQTKAAPPGVRLHIIWPHDGTVVRGGFWLRMGLSGMGVAPAHIAWPDTGHHHVLVDVDEPPQPGEIIPNDRNHLHFGGGQTEARLELPPGRHTLQLVLGDEDHRVFDPPVVSPKITITVR